MEVYVVNNTKKNFDKIPIFVQEILKILTKLKVKIPKYESLTVVFVNSLEMQALNKKFRSIDKPTDVLSFEGVHKESFGEIVLCVDVIQNEPRPFMSHTVYLILHGILHLLGYEHDCDREKEMFELQDAVFSELEKILKTDVRF